MNFQFILTDGLNILRIVKNLNNIFAQLTYNELKENRLTKKIRYTNTVSFTECLNETYAIEWYFIDGDPDNIARMKIYWNIGKDDPNAETLYFEGKNAQKFIAEYIVSWSEDKEESK